MAIHENISLELQPQIVKFASVPSQEYINQNHLKATGDYESYSYTGNKEQIDDKYAELRAIYGSQTSKKASLTRTRMNGYVWRLEVKVEDLEVVPEEISAEEEERLSRKYGTKGNPKLKSMQISNLQQDILTHPEYDAVLPINLGVIRLYQGGAVESDLIPNPTDPTQAMTCGDYMSYDDKLVQWALKYKNYIVPNITLTFTYFSRQKPQIDTSIPRFYDSGEVFCGTYSAPAGWNCMFGGRGSEATEEERGFVVTETYTIGKYPLELYQENS